MRKFLPALVAALFVSTPAAAQNADLSVSRMNQMMETSLSVCRVGRSMEGNMGTNVISLSGARTLEEKMFILSLCKIYIQSKIEDVR